MSAPVYSHTQALMDKRGRLYRRDFLRTVAVGGVVSIGFADSLAMCADHLRAKGKACILLWMQGGPSQLETWDPKPGHANGGETTSIATASAGVEISSHLPDMAKSMNDVCLIRTVTSREANHPRATHLIQTSYLPNVAIKYPSMGAIAAHELGDPHLDLPNFVEIGKTKGRGAAGGGFFGVSYEPFFVADANLAPKNTELAVHASRLKRRMSLLNQLEADPTRAAGQKEKEAHRLMYDKAVKLVLSPSMGAFDLSNEPLQVRERYGTTPFAEGCLLARRLVDVGVPFIKVNLGDWDTHADNFKKSRDLCQQFDRPFAALISDLRDRGRLESTLVVWMGEFGRSPRINPQAGRDHHPRAFSVALAGGGVRGGKIIGATTEDGEDVKSRPVRVSDLICTIYSSLKIDASKELMSNAGRPVRMVDGGEVVQEVFS